MKQCIRFHVCTLSSHAMGTSLRWWPSITLWKKNMWLGCSPATHFLSLRELEIGNIKKTISKIDRKLYWYSSLICREKEQTFMTNFKSASELLIWPDAFCFWNDFTEILNSCGKLSKERNNFSSRFLFGVLYRNAFFIKKRRKKTLIRCYFVVTIRGIPMKFQKTETCGERNSFTSA